MRAFGRIKIDPVSDHALGDKAVLRKQIRDNVVTTLTGLSTTGSRVYASRVYPMAAANLPGLCVYAKIITSNLPFDEWTEIFGSERLTGALLDRLTHHVHILEMNGESHRLNQSQKQRKSPETPA